MANILVLMEHNQSEVKKASLSALNAAKEVGSDIALLVLGKNSKNVASKLEGYAENVIYAEHELLNNYLAQPFAKVLADIATKENAKHVFAASTAFGKDLLPRLAARLKAGMASDIMAVIDEKTYKRPMWAGNVIGTVEVLTDVKVVSVRTTEFENAEKLDISTNISAFEDLQFDENKMNFVKFEEIKSERPDLTEADVIISGGRGLKGEDGFKEMIEPLADHFNAAIGATRAVVDAGWLPNDLQVGQTGKVVAPNLYFAVGLSGAIQHIAGMKGSKTIVAINKDDEAPIFNVADYGLVADLFKVMPELTETIKKLS